MKPVKRLFEEGKRRHCIDRCPVVDRLEKPLDQPIIMEIRQPGYADALGSVLANSLEIPAVMNHIAMADHDSLGAGRRTRGVLQIGQVGGGGVRFSPRIGVVGHYLGDIQVRHRFEARDIAPGAIHERPDGRIGDHDRYPGVGRDRPQPW